MRRDRDTVVLALSPAARVGAGLAALLLVGMLATLIAVLLSLEATRSEIRTTRAGVVDADARLQRASRQLQPLLGAVAPLTRTDAQRRLRRTAGTLVDSVNQLPGLAERARAGVDAATFIATLLDRSDLRGTLATLRAFIDTTGGLLTRTLPDVPTLLRSQRHLTRISTSTALTQLAVTRNTYALLSESLAIQRELLAHARSLDNKFGGPAPATPAPATPLGPG